MQKRRADREGSFRTAFDRNRLIILRTQNICGICGQPVDKSIRSPHPMSATVDHIIPVSKGGHPSDLANLQLAHRVCNLQKGVKLYMAKSAKELQDAEEVNNDDLPLHYDWYNYQANE